jgi:hypothetical protein
MLGETIGSTIFLSLNEIILGRKLSFKIGIASRLFLAIAQLSGDQTGCPSSNQNNIYQKKYCNSNLACRSCISGKL